MSSAYSSSQKIIKVQCIYSAFLKGVLYEYILYSTNANTLMALKHTQKAIEVYHVKAITHSKMQSCLSSYEVQNFQQRLRIKHSKSCQVSLQRGNPIPFLARTSNLTSMGPFEYITVLLPVHSSVPQVQGTALKI